jgi:septal ring-binding cell division protein DamX
LDGETMAKDRKTKTTPDGRHLLVVGLPVGIVLAVLIVGAVLQSGPAPETDQPLVQAEELPLPPPPAYESRQSGDSALEENQLEADIGVGPADAPPVQPQRRQPAPSARPAASVSRLARRVMEDVDRLESSDDDWTAQIGVYCEDQRVTDLVQAHGKNPKLYVLPVLLDERACFRICWGHYGTHDGAAGSRDLPAEFRGEKPLPRRISTVTG